MGCIYKATNKVNGKIYIGKTTGSLDRRIRRHIRETACKAFHRALQKYGRDGFDFKIIYESKNEKELYEKEVMFIKEFKCVVPCGYNINIGGRGGVGRIETKEQVEKKRLTTKKQWENENLKKQLAESVKKSWKNRPSTSGKNNPAAKAVLCVEENKIFSTAREAALWAKCSYPNISQVLHGKRKSSGGYTWKYA
jgi:group I intron endonuclease